jgi:hypothetical protein
LGDKKDGLRLDLILYFYNMLKKMLAYCCILIAGMTLLVHDIVPHHHHGEEAIEQSQSYVSHADHDHHHDFPKHEHPQEDDLFIIRQALVFSPGLGQFFDNNDDCKWQGGLDHYLIQPLAFLFAYPPPNYKIPIGDTSLHFPNSVSFSFGLRAPPTA